jgi:hypothetical protein
MDLGAYGAKAIDRPMDVIDDDWSGASAAAPISGIPESAEG